MFQMKDVGRKIAARRKEMDLTQMELADAMGVSFQAVSNWERGNSMPDIGKLPELASLLDLSIDTLLTDEAPARLVQHIIDGDADAYIEREAVHPETIAEVAPILKPQQTESLLEKTIAQNGDDITIDDLVTVAPFVSEAFLHEWAAKVEHVEGVRPLVRLAPFLSEETLDMLAQRAVDAASIGDLAELAPFLSEASLDRLVALLADEGDVTPKMLTRLAPFLSSATLDGLAANALDDASPEAIAPLAPFLSKETLQRCADTLIARHGLKGIKNIAPFL